MKVAYCCEPQIGGTFTFFRRLRPEFARLGIDFRCVSPISAEKFKGTRFEGAEGVDVITLSDELAVATGQLARHLEEREFDLVMVLPAADVLSSNLPAYLPRKIRCTMRVPMMTRGAYAPAKAMLEHLNAMYAVSDRIADDLSGLRYRVPRSMITTIFHGVDPTPFSDALSHKSSSGPVRALYAGRLWDIDKGVFLLPEMMRVARDAGADVVLSIAGAGPDRDELLRRFDRAGVSDRVTMLGPVPLEAMNNLYRDADVFVFPSRFEGCGFAVLEAMAAACAPLVADIRGSLRVLVDQGSCGRLARVGDGRSFGRGLAELAADRREIRRLQEAARNRVLARFTLDQMASAYASSFRSILAASDERKAPVPLTRYRIPDAFKPTWRTMIPRPVKNVIRAWLERMGISS